MAKKSLSGIIEDKIRDIHGVYSVSEPEFADFIDDCLHDPNLEKSEHFKNTEIRDYKDIASLDTQTLAYLMKGLYAGNQDQIDMNSHLWNESVAPEDAILEDYDAADYSLYWGSGPMQRNDLLIRAIPGHAGSGHCAFGRKKSLYPNTMSVDVSNALSKYPEKYCNQTFKEFADRSQEEINDVVYWLESFFSSPEKNRFARAQKSNKTELSHMQFLKKYKFNMIEALRGFYFAANMDNYDPIRKSVGEKYGVKMGGGKTYAVDINVLKKYNISLKELASVEYTKPFLNFMESDKRIELFKKMGAIIDQDLNLGNIDPANLTWDSVLEQGINPADYPEKDIRKVYIRSARGQGLADDVAIVLAGFMPQTFTEIPHQGDKRQVISSHLGAFFGDRIDTLEKDSSIIIPGGQDEVAGEYLNLRFKKFCQDHKNRKSFNIRNLDDNDYNLISRQVLVDFTAASAITNTNIHSSQRYFLMKQKCKSDGEDASCALKEYVKLVQSISGLNGLDVEPLVKTKSLKSYPDIKIGFSQIPFKDVVNTIEERLHLVLHPNKREKKLKDFYEC